MSKIYRRGYLKGYFRYLRLNYKLAKQNKANLDKNKPKRAKAVL